MSVRGISLVEAEDGAEGFAWRELRRTLLLPGTRTLPRRRPPYVTNSMRDRWARRVSTVGLVFLGASAAAQPVVTGVSGGARGLPEDVAVGPDSVVGSLQPVWVVVRGRGFGPDAIAYLRAPGVDAEVTADWRLRRRPPNELEVRATFGTEADLWTVEVESGGQTSAPYPFRVVPPRPVIERVDVLDGGVGREAYAVRVVGPTIAASSEVLVGGEVVPSEPVRSSPYPGALTVGVEATVPASAFRDGRAEIRVRTPGTAGGGVSEPISAVLPAVPWYAQPGVWLGALAAVVGVGLVLYRGGTRRAGERARRGQLEAEVAQRTAELVAAKRAADQIAERLRETEAERTRLFVNASHDLRTPLAVVAAALDGALDAAPPPVRDRLQTARRGVDRLARLADGLTEAARREGERAAVRPAPGDLGAFVRDAVADHRTVAEAEGVALAAEAPGPVPAVFDPDALRRVLDNLLDNAVRHTPPGGAVRVAAEAVEGWAVLTVADTGPGIAPDLRAHVFERFAQGDPGVSSRRGLGVGLAVVRDLVGRQGGAVDVGEAEGGGAAFTVRLPSHPAPPDAGPVGERTEATGRPRVLVAEDDADLRAVLADTLADAYDVMAVADGAAALAEAERERPAVIVSDVMMPGLDGVALVRALRAAAWGRDVPVVLLTALAGAGDEVRGLAAGADDYLAKPFDREVLLARVRRLMAGRRPTPPVGQGGTPIPSADARLVERARAAVEARLADPDFDVATLGREVGLSRSQITRRLKDAAGTTPAKLIEAVRLDHAAALLDARAGRVKEVAGLVGYRDVRSFSRAFQRATGCAPSEWAGREPDET